MFFLRIFNNKILQSWKQNENILLLAMANGKFVKSSRNDQEDQQAQIMMMNKMNRKNNVIHHWGKEKKLVTNWWWWRWWWSKLLHVLIMSAVCTLQDKFSWSLKMACVYASVWLWCFTYPSANSQHLVTCSTAMQSLLLPTATTGSCLLTSFI